MINNEIYSETLANGIYEKVKSINFGDGFKIKPVITEETVTALKDVLVGIDYRAKINPENGFASMFEGLAFDPQRLRSQSFAIINEETNKPVGTITAIIAPKPWISTQRYFMREENGVRVRDFKAVSGDKLPEFVIIPAWTKVVSEYLGHFAIPGFHAFKKMMEFIQQGAPKNTWMESIAQGEWPVDRRDELTKLTDQGVGTFIATSELPFTLDLIGKNSRGSSSSAKMAPIMGLSKINNLGSSVSLGPSFAKRVG
jgi:hypothetical protein